MSRVTRENISQVLLDASRRAETIVAKLAATLDDPRSTLPRREFDLAFSIDPGARTESVSPSQVNTWRDDHGDCVYGPSVLHLLLLPPSALGESLAFSRTDATSDQDVPEGVYEFGVIHVPTAGDNRPPVVRILHAAVKYSSLDNESSQSVQFLPADGYMSQLGAYKCQEQSRNRTLEDAISLGIAASKMQRSLRVRHRFPAKILTEVKVNDTQHILVWVTHDHVSILAVDTLMEDEIAHAPGQTWHEWVDATYASILSARRPFPDDAHAASLSA